MRRVLQWAVAVLTAAAVAQSFWQYAHLPADVATHFGFDGRPNGWPSREQNLVFQVALSVLLPAFMVGLGRLTGKLPTSMMNLPHRDYWLAPERRAATVAWTGDLLLFTAVFLLGFFLVLFDAVYRANLTTPVRLAVPRSFLLGAPAAYVVAVVVATHRRFWRRAPK